MPLVQASNVFDLILQTYGQPIINIVSSLLTGVPQEKESGKKTEATLNVEQMEAAFSAYIKTAKPGQSLIFFNSLLHTDYVKYNNEPINTGELYNQFGLKFLFKLSFEVIKFNYDDFLSFS